jgi:hypothetical protein
MLLRWLLWLVFLIPHSEFVHPAKAFSCRQKVTVDENYKDCKCDANVLVLVLKMVRRQVR